MTISFSTLFTRIGRFAYAGSIIVTALGTTIEDEIEDAIQELGGSNTIEYETAREGVLAGLRALQAGGASAISTCVVTPCQNLLIQTVKDDNQQPTDSLADALAELNRQMLANASQLDASTVSVTIAYGASNDGSGKLVTSIKRPDGRINEHAFDEDIECIITAAPTTGAATISIKGELSVSILSYNWPQGSGATGDVACHTASSGTNLVGNGTFESEDSTATHLPSGWIASVATLGTTLKMTSVEVQTVIISGSPGSGYYLLHFTNRDGIVSTTAPLAWNAASVAVQTALQAIPELASATVVESGTTPNFTHTITFTNVSNPGQLTSTNALNTGSIAHATSTAGSANVLRGARAVEFDSDAAQLTTLNRAVALTAKTQYAVNAFFLADVVPAAGVMTVDLVDGIGGTVLRDDQGFYNSLRIPCSTALTTSFQALQSVITAVNEVQTLSSTATGGTFTLALDGQTTGNIAWDASVATIKTALELLSNIDVDEVSLSGGALPGTPVVITFLGRWAAQDVPALVVDNTLATGGTASIAETTKGSSGEAVFRTPTDMPDQVYLRIRISTAISNTSSVFVDEVCMVPMSQLYTGGIYASAFTGRQFWSVDDTIRLTVANNRAGLLNEWCNRIFALRESELLFQTNRTGSESVADSVVS